MATKIPQKFLSGREMRWVLNNCGFNMSEFAAFLGRSKAFVTTLLQNQPQIGLQYIDDLESFVGPENFDFSMKIVLEYRKKREAERKKRAEAASAA